MWDQRSLKCLRAMSEREIDGVSDLVRGRRPAGMSVEMMAHPRLQRKERTAWACLFRAWGV